MRLDKFLKVVQLIKRRTVANEAGKEGVISVNGKKVKPSYQVKAGDIINIDLATSSRSVKVISVPEKQNVSKEKVSDYIQMIDYSSKRD